MVRGMIDLCLDLLSPYAGPVDLDEFIGSAEMVSCAMARFGISAVAWQALVQDVQSFLLQVREHQASLGDVSQSRDYQRELATASEALTSFDTRLAEQALIIEDADIAYRAAQSSGRDILDRQRLASAQLQVIDAEIAGLEQKRRDLTVGLQQEGEQLLFFDREAQVAAERRAEAEVASTILVAQREEVRATHLSVGEAWADDKERVASVQKSVDELMGRVAARVSVAQTGDSFF